MALYDPLDKHAFRNHLVPVDNEGLDIGISGRRFNNVRAAAILTDGIVGPGFVLNANNMTMTAGTVSALNVIVSNRLVMAAGTAALPGLTSALAINTGFFDVDGALWGFSSGGFVRFGYNNGGIVISDNAASGLGFSSNAAIDNVLGGTLVKDGGSGLLAWKLGTTATAFRVYGTTTGPKYLSLSHDGTDGIVDVSASSGKLKLGGSATDIQYMKATVALGGGAAPTLGTIGGSGPAVSAQNSWIRILDSAGNARFIPCWA